MNSVMLCSMSIFFLNVGENQQQSIYGALAVSTVGGVVNIRSVLEELRN